MLEGISFYTLQSFYSLQNNNKTHVFKWLPHSVQSLYAALRATQPETILPL